MSKTLFNTNLDEEYVPMAEDLTKMFVILIVVNFLMFVSNPKTNKFLGESYIKLMTFILLGLATYWLVVKKLISYN
jgi:hypothetical protein